ncbi:MAG TPA: hypothetical protein VIL92_11650 [Gaiellaceae bacterium]
MSGGDPEANAAVASHDVTPEIAATMYLSLSEMNKRRVADFVGPGRLARFFARISPTTKEAVAASLTRAHADVFLEPFMAVPLAASESDQLMLFADLLGALIQKERRESRRRP